ncbi:histidinol-phosphate transaminase [Litoreibacter roseus]|uniref:Histidinol-phosphate aminotransferase n=1 Tax=Litoreibacter roseus TaxID=2601869 RepID=A0A6N6JFX9_9RHOB|nr:histidinol-phosphate transaminase [Litoreibacter roseus]GFE65263.1 histidinol-phosphate aminotransferase [Litoreibacter roseus]
MTIYPQPGIMDISLYQGGAGHIEGVSDVVKLSSNENPLGPSPRASDALRQAAGMLHLYPSTTHDDLRTAIGNVHEMDPEQIICGVGSDEIISFLCYAFAGPGDEVLYTEHGFAMYRISALAAGATPVVAPETDRTADVDAILDACTSATRLVFIANPNNPTGTMISEEDIERLADNLPDEVLLVLDGAYAEYVEGYDGGKSIIDARENVFMTRTFSKIYGLGGLRVGWGYGPQNIIDVLNRIRGPFNLSSPALVAAEAAMRDQAYIARCRSENLRLRAMMSEEFARIGIVCDPSFANFLLPRFDSEEMAEGCDAYLKTRGVIVRKVGGYGLPHCLRVTIGDELGCKRAIRGIEAYLAGKRSLPA